VWSRDGRKMAFINPPDQGIYLINADGSQGRKLVTGLDPDGGLAWQLRGLSPREGTLCKKSGTRYAGATAEGAEVCFTLTTDRSMWVEIGFRFVPASRCPHTTGTGTGKTYYEGRDPLTGPGRIVVPGFTATIHGARASGVLADSETCKGKTFKWSARRAP
jgi:hypothetical protein